ncbi:MAG TPA: hypothetical protein DEO95_02860, partial [Ruminococcaceae bacterium]|nr:hypothetical protein [Oscillospiraceae bacterium]
MHNAQLHYRLSNILSYPLFVYFMRKGRCIPRQCLPVIIKSGSVKMKTVTRIETEERKRHVLVVDDEMINRLLLGHILQNEFEIHYAADGEQALAFVEKEYETLSIILLDLLMPKVDGFQVL